MTRFDAATAVEELEWDFTTYKGGSGVVPEPSTGRLNAFFDRMRLLATEIRDIQRLAEELNVGEEDEDPTDEQITEAVDKMGELTSEARVFQTKTMEAIAELCGANWEESDCNEDGSANPPALVGGSPSLEQLETLPYRVLQEFTKWIMGEVRPKTSSRPDASDHLRKAKRKRGSSRRVTSS